MTEKMKVAKYAVFSLLLSFSYFSTYVKCFEFLWSKPKAAGNFENHFGSPQRADFGYWDSNLLKVLNEESAVLTEPNMAIQCHRDLLTLARGLENLEIQAQMFYDFNGKVPNNLMRLPLKWDGAYDSCPKLAYKIQESKSIFKGKNCALGYFIQDKSKVEIHKCVPNSCTPDYLNQYYKPQLDYQKRFFINLTKAKDKNGKLMDVDQDVELSIHYTCKEEYTLSNAGYIVGIIFISIFGICLCCSFPDLLTLIFKNPNQDSKTGNEPDSSFCQCLSFIRNTKDLMKIIRKPSNIDCLVGIKVFCVVWLSLVHLMMTPTLTDTVASMLTVPEKYDNSAFLQFLGKGTLAVDTFFFLSGFLLTYISLKNSKPLRVSQVFLGILYRYFRLNTPLVFLGLFSYILPTLGSGPFWIKSNIVLYTCTKSMWSNILMTTNLSSDFSTLCLPWSWYICCDMQFFSVGIILIYFYKRRNSTRNKKMVNLVIYGFISWSLMYRFYICWTKSMPPFFAKPVEASLIKKSDWFELMMPKPQARIYAYLFGMCVGARFKAQQLFNKRNSIIMWILTILVMRSLIVVPNQYEFELLASTLYNTFSGLAWLCCVTWVIHSCFNGQSVFLNWLLSADCLVPIGRLSYCIYLVHIVIQYQFFMNQRKMVVFDILYLVVNYIGLILPVLAFALIWYLLFEITTINLLNKYLKA